MYNTQTIKKIMMSFALAITMIAMACMLCACDFGGAPKYEEQKFTTDEGDMTITLNSSFEKSGSIDMDKASYSTGLKIKNNDMQFQFFRYKDVLTEYTEKPTLTFMVSSYADLNKAVYNEETKICYLPCSAITSNLVARRYFFKTTDALYVVYVQYVEEKVEQLEEWVSTIKFNKEQVFDFTTTQNPDKRIYFDSETSASIRVLADMFLRKEPLKSYDATFEQLSFKAGASTCSLCTQKLEHETADPETFMNNVVNNILNSSNNAVYNYVDVSDEEKNYKTVYSQILKHYLYIFDNGTTCYSLYFFYSNENSDNKAVFDTMADSFKFQDDLQV